MRVALVTPDLERRSEGFAVSVPQLAAALAAEGAGVEPHTIGNAPGPLTESVSLHVARPAWPRRLARSPELRRSMLASPSDVVHAHGLWMLPLRYASQASRARGVPLVVSPRGMLAPSARRRSGWKKALAPRAPRVAAGGGLARHVGAGGGRHPRRRLRGPFCVAPNGVTPRRRGLPR